MADSPRLITLGARQLRALLKQRGITLNAFCNEHSLDYAWVHRVITGQRGQRVSIDFAKAMFDASEGEIPLDAWSSDTLAPADGAEAESVSP